MIDNNIANEIAFSQPVINIGADSGNDIILHGDTIADFHAMLHFDGTEWNLIPLDEKHPVMMNGLSVGMTGCRLSNGAVVMIGAYQLTLSLNGINSDIQVLNKSMSTVTASADSGGSGEQNIILSLLSASAAEVNAGGNVEYELSVTNAGPLVANMQLQVQGIPTNWVKIIPPVLNLNEGRKETFTVQVSVPRESSAMAGIYNLHFVAISPNYPRETGTADTSLNVLPYTDFLLNGPTPHRISLRRGHDSDFADLVIINNSNASSTFMVQAYDDANELQFSFRHLDNTLSQGQAMIQVDPGDNVRVPMRIVGRNLPLFGLSRQPHHYYANVVPSDRQGDQQSVIGEVVVRPLINTLLLILTLLLLIVAGLFIFQPYIHQFSGDNGSKTQVILSGSSARLDWNVSPFAGTVTLNDGKNDTPISRRVDHEYVSPNESTVYTLKAENFISRLLKITFERTVNVMVVPARPSVDLFQTNTSRINFGGSVDISWAVSTNSDSAELDVNRQTSALTAENFSGTRSETLSGDTLLAMRADNGSGFDVKSLLVKVSSENIRLKRFVAWVRPSGIAVPANNNIQNNTRWSALQLNLSPTATPQTLRSASVNPMPVPQSNVLDIPDNYQTVNQSLPNMNPEQQSVSGQNSVQNNSYQVLNGESYTGLLVSPGQTTVITATPMAPTARVPETAYNATAVPLTSPERGNSDFSIKLVEVVEDPSAESGYRVIDYFPDYVLQKSEQVLIEWEVEGISKIKIDNLSTNDLNASGQEFVYPEKSTNYVLNGTVGSVSKSYSLPVRVQGDADDGQGSGLNCDLKANATTLTVPGTVMLTWTGAGTNRVQLLSSAQAEKENDDAEKQREAEAKANGQTYTRPTNAPLTGGTIGDYLQPSGFMRVNVDKQTTFVLNAYDGSGNVICTKSVEVKYTGGNDKQDLKLRIVKVTDTNDVSQESYAVGQTVQVTVALSDYLKGKDPTGSITVTDGYSTCSMTYPVTSCSFAAKHPGTMKLTAVYSGDDTYNKKTATGSMKVVDKVDTTLKILTSGKTTEDRIFVMAELDWDAVKAAGRTPTGTVEIIPYKGSTPYTIKYDLATGKLDHDGNHEVVVLKDDSGRPKGLAMFFSYLLTDSDELDRISMKYDGDNFFNSSSAVIQKFDDVNEVTVDISDVTLSEDSTKFDYTVTLSYDLTIYEYWGIIPTGNINLTIGSTACTLAVDTGKVKCGNTDMTDAVITDTTDSGKDVVSYKLTGMPNSDVANETLTAVYEGDTVYRESNTASYTYPRVATGIDLKGIEEDGSGRFNITVQITYAQKGGNVTKYFPSKTLTYVTKSSGTTCSVTLSPVSGATMSSGCGDSTVRINWSASDTSTWVSVNHLWLPANDTTFEVTYDGDGRYEGSGPASGTIQRKLEMYQKTTNQYLYANLPGIDSAYPMYPPYPTDYSDPAEECRTGSAACVTLKDSVNFSVYVKKSGTTYLPSDAKLTLSGGGLSSTITCTPNNEYSNTEAECTFSNVSFSSTGLKNLTVSYSDGSSKYYADDLKLQPIIVVRASLNGAYTKSWFTSVKNSSTGDAYNEGDTIPQGTTVELTLKITDNNGTDVSQTNYLVYGYNSSTHERFNMAQGEYKGTGTNTISLTLNSADIDRIVVEHLGSEATGQRPSVGIFTVNVSGTSGTSSLGSSQGGSISLSPVSLSVELEPLGSGE